MTTAATAFALKWASRGFRVFPLRPNTVEPRDRAFYESATSDPVKVVELFGKGNWNIGVATDELLVVDVDVKNGKPGLETFVNLDLPLNTLVVKTPSGGYHYYYTGPRTANTTEKLGPGVDTRGWHGYVVAPGSMTPRGFYTLEQEAPVQEAPEHIVARLKAPREHQRNEVQVAPDDEIALAAAEAFLRATDGAVEGQHGDADTYKVACQLKDLGVSELTALELMLDIWNPKCSPPWDADDLEKKIGNAYAYGENPVGVAHPRADFAGVSIPEVVTLGRRWVDQGEAWETDTQWLFYNMLPTSGLALLTGPPGSGKTFLAAHLAERLATGEPFFGEGPDEPGGTIFLAAEGVSSLGPRFAVLGKGRGKLPITGTPVDPLVDRSTWNNLLRDMHEKCGRIEKQHAMPVRLVVLDTLSASGLITDENNNAECAKAMKKLEQLGHQLGALVLVLHHPPKTGGGLRGGSSILASADYVLEIERDENRPIRTLSLTKGRDAEAPRVLGAFGLNTIVLGQDSRGRNITTCELQVSTSKVFAAGGQPKAFPLFLEAIQWARADDGVPSGDPVKVETVMRAFEDRKPAANSKASRTIFRECLKYAHDTGLVDRFAEGLDEYILERKPDVPLS